MQMTGAKILMECLLEQGVDTIFGYPGGTILNVYDELYYYEDRVKHILTAHEQGACHAADGYARSTGKVGVCFATSGPGATNLVTGIATAYMDSSPIVCITCNVGTDLLGKDELIDHQNEKIKLTGLTVEAANEEGAAFLYNWDGSGSPGNNNDLYFNVSDGTSTYTLTVESYLCGEGTDVYTTVTNLNVGDVIDVEGFLYWYNGAQPHVTSVTVK